MSEPQLTEEELRQLEAELDRISVEDVILQTIVSLINIGARKGGLGAPPGQAPAPDWAQTKMAIEGCRALLPLLEADHAEQLGPVRDAISQLQMAYAQQAGAAGAAGGGGGSAPGGGEQAPPRQAPPKDQGPGGGRLWVPGQ